MNKVKFIQIYFYFLISLDLLLLFIAILKLHLRGNITLIIILRIFSYLLFLFE